MAVLEAFINGEFIQKVKLQLRAIDPVVAESQHRRVQKHGQISVEADDAKVKIKRVTAKLEGKDFNEVDENTNTLTVKDQVPILSSTFPINVCYLGRKINIRSEEYRKLMSALYRMVHILVNRQCIYW